MSGPDVRLRLYRGNVRLDVEEHPDRWEASMYLDASGDLVWRYFGGSTLQGLRSFSRVNCGQYAFIVGELEPGESVEIKGAGETWASVVVDRCWAASGDLADAPPEWYRQIGPRSTGEWEPVGWIVQ